MAQYSDGNMNSNDFWEQRKDHPGPDAVRTAAMVATGLDVLSAEDEREALRVRRWRHNIQKVLLQTSPAVALTHEQAHEVNGWFSNVEAYDKMTLYSLNYSKLDKVLNRVIMLENSVKLRGDPYQICVRARTLVERWQPSSLPRILREAPRPQYFPPALRASHMNLDALSAQSHTSSLDLLASVSTAERLATRTPRPPRRTLVSTSTQTDDPLLNGVNGTQQPPDVRMADGTVNVVQNGTR
ncbi:hypothetical protein PENSPDRAFT_760112 [Peniophora sp. CONT]|nr:hypothetical protein PENSPDRAFT_760112 [Peniophora sp. CONT]